MFQVILKQESSIVTLPIKEITRTQTNLKTVDKKVTSVCVRALYGPYDNVKQMGRMQIINKLIPKYHLLCQANSSRTTPAYWECQSSPSTFWMFRIESNIFWENCRADNISMGWMYRLHWILGHTVIWSNLGTSCFEKPFQLYDLSRYGLGSDILM